MTGRAKTKQIIQRMSGLFARKQTKWLKMMHRQTIHFAAVTAAIAVSHQGLLALMLPVCRIIFYSTATPEPVMFTVPILNSLIHGV